MVLLYVLYKDLVPVKEKPDKEKDKAHLSGSHNKFYVYKRLGYMRVMMDINKALF